MSRIYANDIPAGSAIHPGEIISDEIRARNLKNKDLANQMTLSSTVLSDLIHGRRNITAELALKLESALGISAMFWMNIQSKYDLDRARKKSSLSEASISPITEDQ
jgi:HTH-type transcriptional regulator/antitoxin HigA